MYKGKLCEWKGSERPFKQTSDILHSSRPGGSGQKQKHILILLLGQGWHDECVTICLSNSARDVRCQVSSKNKDFPTQHILHGVPGAEREATAGHKSQISRDTSTILALCGIKHFLWHTHALSIGLHELLGLRNVTTGYVLTNPGPPRVSYFTKKKIYIQPSPQMKKKL